MVLRVVEDVAQRVPRLARRGDHLVVVALLQDRAFAAPEPIERLRQSNEEALHAARDRVAAWRLDDQVKVIGLGLPNENKSYVHQGITDSVVLWNTMDLGYLTIFAADAISKGTLKPGVETLAAGRLGALQVRGDNVLLGEPFTFNKTNIDQFDF